LRALISLAISDVLSTARAIWSRQRAITAGRNGSISPYRRAQGWGRSEMGCSVSFRRKGRCTRYLPPASPAAKPPILPLGDALVARDREMIEAALAETKGTVSGPSGAAARLGIPGSTLESRIRALKIRKSQYKGS
jgi:transcriptional regulator with GAF, ATPase, and Fis domain